MTIAASQARFLSLTARKSNIELKLTQISERRMRLSYQSSSIFTNQINSYNSSSSSDSSSSYSSALYEAQTERIQQQDLQFELQQNQLETQLKTVSAEHESIQKLIDNNAKNEFKIFG